MKNWNHAVRQISPASKYYKMVHADDMIFPRCIELMVRVAEKNPSVGIVGSYGLKGKKVVSDGLPFPDEYISGRDLCRLALHRQVRPFPRPTSILIRSDLTREKDSFYNHPNLHADHEVCYDILRDHDFGFVYQVLTFMRVHEESQTTEIAKYKKLYHTNLELLVKYGPVFLSKDEYKNLLKKRLDEYYAFLAFSLFSMKDGGFWEYHRNALSNLGHGFTRFGLYRIILSEIANKPRMTLAKIKRLILEN
jgi:hypothetical protein